MDQSLEKMLGNVIVLREIKSRSYQTIESCMSVTTDIYCSDKPLKPSFTKNTAYYPLTENGQVGITHHPEGLGKLKYNEEGTEYGVPLIDILDKPLEKWRIDKK